LRHRQPEREKRGKRGRGIDPSGYDAGKKIKGKKRNTLPIFCLHVLFVAGTRIVLAKLVGISEVMLILPAAIFAGIAGPLMIVAIAERYRLRSALGLG
jgi:hypothetical protein